MPTFHNGEGVTAESSPKLRDSKSASKRNPLGERVHHGNSSLAHSQSEHTALQYWQILLHSLKWIDGFQGCRKNTYQARVLQAVRQETIAVHFCYHIRNITAEK